MSNTMIEKKELLRGWEEAGKILGADVASSMGQKYVEAVNGAISALENEINSFNCGKLDISKIQGFLFEKWAAGTFNIDAAASGSSDRATVPNSRALNSVDIRLDSGFDFSAKSMKNAEKSVSEQFNFSKDTRESGYKGQGRLVPSDKLAEAKAIARKRSLKNSISRPDVSAAYAEVESKLTDTVKNQEGVSSAPIERKELDKIAQESREKSFKASEHGAGIDNAIKTEYMLKQALNAGLTSATVSLAFQIVPEIFKSIDYLIKHGEISLDQIGEAGKNTISAGAKGFIRGSVASGLLIEAQKGALGNAFKNINPTFLGTMVALVLQTFDNGIKMARGKMTARQMGSAFIDSVVVSGGYLAGAHLGGMIGQAIGLGLPMVGYLIGSLLGASASIVYNIGKKKLISLCINTGFTCFGLVEQNYEIPDEIMHKLGFETARLEKAKFGTSNLGKAHFELASLNLAEFETVDFVILRRGLIGVNKIGYIPANHP